MTIVNVRAAFSIATVVLVGATALFAATTAVAPVEDSATVPATASVGPSDPKELEAFIDGMMAAHLPSRKIPAATIAVVKDGELFFAKGYGLADREKKIPVDADEDPVPARFDLQALHVDGGHAARRARRDRPRRRRQQLPEELQDSGDLPRADHHEAPPHPHAPVSRTRALGFLIIKEESG